MIPDIEHARNLCFVMKQAGAGIFLPVLQGGFLVKCKTGVTIEDLLKDDFGITREYMERRLSTVFLDGQCIDDIDGAIVRSGMTLALSSAMPGLVGATLRRKSILASMRSSITHHEDAPQTEPAQEGLITVKLFNILAGELGPLFLARGIYLKAADMASLLHASGKAFWSNVCETLLDGRPVSSPGIIDALNDDTLIRLTAKTAPAV